MVTGWSRGVNDTREHYTAKYAAEDGSLLWERRGPVGNVETVVVDSNGDVVLIGSAGSDCYTAKYAAHNGAPLWEKRSNVGCAVAVALDRNGNVVVTGRSGLFPSSAYYTAKYAAVDGALLWEKLYDRGLQGGANAVAVDGIGDVIVTGTFSSTNVPFTNYTMKYSGTDGALLWEKHDGPRNAYLLALGPNGTILVSGYSPAPNGDDYATVADREERRGSLLTVLSRSGNDFQFAFEGANGVIYPILASTNLVDWSVIGIATTVAPGQFRFTDASAGQFPARFYRLKTP